MTVFEMARDLGAAILSSDEGKRLFRAKAAFDEDAEAQVQMNLYKEFSKDLHNKMELGELSHDDFKNESVRLAQMGRALKSHPVTGELIDAENDFNRLVNQVSSIIKATVTGDDCSSGCGGTCNSCK